MLDITLFSGTAGSGVCRRPVHGKPGGQRLLPEPVGAYGVPERPERNPHGPVSAEEPSPAAPD